MSLRAIPLLLAITTCMAISTAQAVTTGTLRFTGQINAGTCNLAAGDVSRTVTLPTVKVPDFNNALFTGQTSFEISADCESDIRNVTFLFAGTPDTGNGALFNNTGTSAGLGVWLRAGAGTTRTVVPANGTPAQCSRTIPTASSRAVLGLDAAYHKNNATISRGTLASAVTVSITYD
jgi:major type 1 subunit fimbrin (pilin)